MFGKNHTTQTIEKIKLNHDFTANNKHYWTIEKRLKQSQKCKTEITAAWKNPNSKYHTEEFKELKRLNLKLYPRKGKSKNSSIEIKIKEILEGLYITYKFQEWIGPYCIDFLIPEHNIIIEADGKFSHGDPRYFKPTDIIQGKCSAQEKWDYDIKRDNFLREKGFIILHFWEKEINNEINLVKELIKCNIIKNS
jgi:very-short-patch-repair endonuclease